MYEYSWLIWTFDGFIIALLLWMLLLMKEYRCCLSCPFVCMIVICVLSVILEAVGLERDALILGSLPLLIIGLVVVCSFVIIVLAFTVGFATYCFYSVFNSMRECLDELFTRDRVCCCCSYTYRLVRRLWQSATMCFARCLCWKVDMTRIDFGDDEHL